MGWTKSSLIVVACGILFTASQVCAGSEKSKDQQPPSYQHTGVIKAKGEETHILKVKTEGGMLNFRYKRHGKKQCAGFKELAVGDTVAVTASDNKPVSEATCILKKKPDSKEK
jgi:hypothetical protein